MKNKYHKPSSNGCGSLGLEVRLLSTDQSTIVLFKNLNMVITFITYGVVSVTSTNLE